MSHGLLLVNKPSGFTSHDVVGRVRRIFGTREVGHSGTLDPLADGLMVLLVGEGTKLSNYIIEKDKSYRVVARLGVRTDTLDRTGQVVATSQDRPSKERVREAAASLTGDFQWPVPVYSATKVGGVPLHKKAREGQVVVAPTKKMVFWNVDFEAFDGELATFHLRCAKGSFVRTWVDQLGVLLGCGATVEALTRTSTPPFRLEEARALEDIEGMSAEERGALVIPLNRALPQIKTIRVVGQDEFLLQNGQISHDLRAQLITRVQVGDELFQIQSHRRQLLALIALEKEKGFQIRRVFRAP